MSARHFWINQAFFQASWPACVVGAAYGLLWPGALVVGAFAAWQLTGGRAHRDDGRALLWFLAAGLCVDTAWVQLGVVEYATAWPFSGTIPAWLLLLWVAFALTVNHSLAIFRSRWRLFALIASVGSPMSYSVARRVGAVEWTAPDGVVLLCVGPVWALLVALLFRQVGAGGRERRAEETSLGALRG